MPRGSTWVAIAFILGGSVISLTGIGLIIGVPMILFGLLVWMTGGIASAIGRITP